MTSVSPFLRVCGVSKKHQIRKDPIVQQSGAEITNKENPTLSSSVEKQSKNIINAKHRYKTPTDRYKKANKIYEIDFGGGSDRVDNENDRNRVVTLIFVDVILELDLHRWLSFNKTKIST